MKRSVRGLPTERSSHVMAPDAGEVAFEIPGNIFVGHQHEERSRWLVGARVLARNIGGEGRKDPALAFPVRAQTGAPCLRLDSTGKHVDKDVARCRRRTVQDRRSAGFIVDNEGRRVSGRAYKAPELSETSVTVAFNPSG